VELPLLFSPARIGAMRLRNRLVMSPMENMYAAQDGAPSRRSIDYFEARARGGVGLITLGASSIDALHREVPNGFHFSDDAVIPAHRALVEAVHAHGARIQPQLVHPGPDGLGPEMHGVASLGPSAIQSYLTGTTSRAITPEELAGVVDLFRAAARRVREAGYDGVELHAAHGYMLLGSFLTPWRNARRDDWSARDPEGRTRAVAEVVRAIKAEVGADFPLTLRISGYERQAGGRDLTDTQRIAPALEAAGVDAFHVSGGVIDRLVTRMVNGAHDGDALNAAAAAAVKRVVAVPVIAVGRIHDPRLAERLLSEGSADLVAMGRPLLADPELPDKARQGRLAEIRRCISCQGCIDSLETRFALDCTVNPRTGREAQLGAARTDARRHLVVVGGGPAGLEAARVAAERGHRVDLYERDRRLGGALIAACAVHPENQPFLDWLTAGVRRAGVSVHLGAPLTADAVAALRPDAVIVATGGRLAVPALPGADLPHVRTGAMLRERLRGRAGSLVSPRLLRRLPAALLPLGRRVVVIGGDLAAVELASFLASRGRRVSVLETGDRLAPEVGPKRRGEELDRLDRAGVPVNTGVAIRRIEADGVVVDRPAGGFILVPADTVILAGSLEPDTTLYDALADRVAWRRAVGDCTGLGLIHKAALEGARAACEL
jgi:2,4-dienoyl-CoA reductase (NADPH2)